MSSLSLCPVLSHTSIFSPRVTVWRPLIAAAVVAINRAAEDVESRSVLRALTLVVQLASGGRAIEIARAMLLQTDEHAADIPDDTDLYDEVLVTEVSALLSALTALLRNTKPAAVAARGLALKFAPALLLECRHVMGVVRSAAAVVQLLCALESTEGALSHRALGMRAADLTRGVLADHVWLTDTGTTDTHALIFVSVLIVSDLSESVESQALLLPACGRAAACRCTVAAGRRCCGHGRC